MRKGLVTYGRAELSDGHRVVGGDAVADLLRQLRLSVDTERRRSPVLEGVPTSSYRFASAGNGVAEVLFFERAQNPPHWNRGEIVNNGDPAKDFILNGQDLTRDLKALYQ
jgi:hypothetical protein